MPTYQYTCTDCGHFFEAVQSFSDNSLTVCPACEGSLRKVFNAVGVVFKGSGFYRNDSRGTPTSASPAASTGTSEPATASTSTSSSTSDTSSSTSSSSTTTKTSA